MQAFVKYGAHPREAELRSVPSPVPSEMEVLVAVTGCGICGSDLHAYEAAKGYEWVTPPVTLGHEFGGTVVSVGPRVTGFTRGDRVVVVAIQGCMTCAACCIGNTNLCLERKVIGLSMDGGMATHAIVDARHLIHVPEKVDFSQVALIEPASVALQALSKVQIHPNDRVVVSGPGSIGLICCMIAALYKAKVVLVGSESDVRTRFNIAEKLGFATVNVDRDPELAILKSVFDGAPPDLWVEASGAPSAFISGVERLRQGGALVVVAMYGQSFSWQPTAAVRSALSIFFSYASVSRDYHQALSLMAEGLLDLSPLMNVYQLSDVNRAFDAARAKQVIKPVLIT